MLTIREYVRPQTLEEAYTLCQKKSSVVLGGMLWLRMQNSQVGTAIDLCELGLNHIEETPDDYVIGAMVSLRQLEQHPGLAALTQAAMAEAVKHIVGVQFRNLATVGGSLYGRFGFSDVLTLFLALEARVELYHAGMMSLADFIGMPRQQRDILVRVYLPRAPRRVVYLSQRNSATDFPTLTCAIARQNGQTCCVIGARPMRAMAFDDEKGLLAAGVNETSAAAFAKDLAARVPLGSNLRAGEEYRRLVCEALVRRGLVQMEGC